MIHYQDISETDASAVVKVRMQELSDVMAKLSARLITDEAKLFNWGDVGTISRLVEILEDFESSFTDFR